MRSAWSMAYGHESWRGGRHGPCIGKEAGDPNHAIRYIPHTFVFALLFSHTIPVTTAGSEFPAKAASMRKGLTQAASAI